MFQWTPDTKGLNWNIHMYIEALVMSRNELITLTKDCSYIRYSFNNNSYVDSALMREN